jgi:homoserine kinase type II
MALFSQLSPADVEEAARVFDLGAVTHVEGIATGTVNSNYAVEAAAGRFFLRINEGKSQGDVAYEAELCAHLARRGVPTPGPRWARLKVGWVTLFPWVDGVHRAGAELSARDVEQVGEALAALHLAGRDFGRRQASRYAFQRIVERWEGLEADCCDAGLMSAITDVGAEIDWLRRRTAARAALPAGVIHGDLFPDNVLYAGDRLVALLDFEQASDGAFAYDLAVCLCAWCYHDDFVAEHARALVGGYQRVRPLEASERELLWVEARAAAMRFTVTRITDVYLNPEATAAVRAGKDYRRYHRRLERLRAMESEGFRKLVEGSS